MWTTGLVSLSIHEALTLGEGVEIALNPDLFNDHHHQQHHQNATPAATATTSSTTVGGGARSTLQKPPTTQQHHQRNSSRDSLQAALSSDTDSKTDEGNKAPIMNSSSFSTATPSGAAAVAATATVSSHGTRRLEVGDMIEIRVWDALPGSGGAKSKSSPRGTTAAIGTSSGHSRIVMAKRRSPPPSKDSSRVPSGANSVTTTTGCEGSGGGGGGGGTAGSQQQHGDSGNVVAQKPSSLTSATLEAAVTTLQTTSTGRPPPASSSSSLQYSMDSSFPNTFEKNDEVVPKESDTSTVSSVERAKETIGTLPSDPPSPKGITVTAGTLPAAAAATGGGGSNSDDTVRSGMPPTFPRTRADTTDGVSHAAAAAAAARPAVPKPPSVQRARTTATMPTDTTAVAAATMSSAATVSHHRRTSSSLAAPAQQKKHVRDISDMTMDTVMASHVADIGESGRDDDGGGVDQEDEDDTLSGIALTHSLRFSFVMLVTEGTLTSLKESARTQVSILRQVADLYNLSSYDMVTVNLISKEEEPGVVQTISADFVTVTIKEQYISRGDMHFFQESLVGKWIYEGQRLSNTTKGIQAHAREIRHGKRLAKSGIITDDTMITFRSRSARIFWLVQLSSEMWDYASPYNSFGDEESSCEIFFDKFVSFMHRVFEKWQELEVTHSLTVVFFSRTYLYPEKGIGQARKHSERRSESTTHANVDVRGRLYEDHYKTVIENETTADWDSLIVRIKREFVRYPFEVGWDLSTEYGRHPSSAAQGNLLEAVNVTLNLMQFHFMDRDLHRVGNSIVVISAGCGVFEVGKTLAGITYQRMMDNGIGSDMLSLGLPPLHTAPFFLYNNDLFGVESHGVDQGKSYYEVPHWMHLSFFSYGDEAYSQEFDQSKEKKDTALSGCLPHDIEVAPNGFYIPNLQSEAEKNLIHLDARRASFSAAANVAASPIYPSTSKSRQRQLISGRKFTDILEACRPGATGHSMPSALSSLLSLHESTKAAKEKKADISDCVSHAENVPTIEEPYQTTNAGSSHLKAWGAIDLDVADAAISQSPTNLAAMRKQSDASDPLSDRSSPTSSFSSHFSNLIGGRSWERATSLCSYSNGFNLRSGPAVDGIQMQRSPSMDSLLESSSHAAIDSDSDGEQAHNATFKDEKTCTENNGENLRKQMKDRDKSFFDRTPRSHLMDGRTSQLVTKHTSDGSMSSGETKPSSNVLAASQTLGGIGAALQNHNSSDVKAIPSESALVKRNKSVGRLREMHQQTQSPFALSRSLGPLQGTPPQSSQFRPPAVTSRGSDPLESLPASRGFGKFSGGRNSSLNANVGFLAASSPPRSNNVGQKTRSPPSPSDESPLRRHITAKRSHHSKRRHRALNPFKQQDEEAVLAEKSHNRRRWSHVFPLGEIEFKRHAGPNWKSLSQPAILPLTIDYYPPPQELGTFLDRNWDIEVDVEGTNYKNHSALMMEMIRQRLTQDYQIVPPSVVQESRRRDEAAAQLVIQERRTRTGVVQAPMARGFIRPENVSLGGRGRSLKSLHHGMTLSPTGSPRSKDDVIVYNLSMGHTIHVLKYDPNTKKIVVKQRSKKLAHDNSFRYKYLLYSPTTQNYVKVVQDFHEFSNEYRWNQVDHLIGGIEGKKVKAEMKFRQVMFALIPDRHGDKSEEQAYIDRFKKLLGYLNKLREGGDNAEEGLNVQIVSGDDKRIDPRTRVPIVRREAADMMKRTTVQLRKTKRDLYEWLDIAVDPTFDTKCSYRIIVQWLVASSSKVETQVQLLQRRCAQYGLRLVTYPQVSISPNLFLNPLMAPSFLCIRDKDDADLLDSAILERGFVDDGINPTEKTFLDCIHNADDFQFGRRRGRVSARQFVHRSGTLFLRLIRDDNGRVILVGIENRKLIGNDSAQREASRLAFRQIEDFVKTLPSADVSQHDTPVK